MQDEHACAADSSVEANLLGFAHTNARDGRPAVTGVGPLDANLLLSEISDLGRDPVRGGYTRKVLTGVELDLRRWFIDHATGLGLDVETDANGVIWAWWDLPSGDRTNAVVTGSHLDSVPGGGEFDGPLGVASALAAVAAMQQQADLVRTRPLAIAVFPEEEGSRFGVACLGSRLLTGAIAPERALGLQDVDGTTYAEALTKAGFCPQEVGPDHAKLALIGDFVELHVEQGRGLADLASPVAVASTVLGHGRWRLSFSGQGNHAGTTLMADRRDPMVATGRMIAAIRDAATSYPGARATIGRVVPVPGGTNVIASRVDAWLDARHEDDAITAALVGEIYEAAGAIAAEEGCEVTLVEESLSHTIAFDETLSQRLAGAIGRIGVADAGATPAGVPVLATGAGHDAALVADHTRAAMLFVRNPSGISHAPEEYSEPGDVTAGVAALTASLVELVR